MGKTTSIVATALLAAGLCVSMGSLAHAQSHHNPVDEVSNSQERDYTDVGKRYANMDAPFVRDGIVQEPKLFTTITAGLEEAQVLSALGEPLRKGGVTGKKTKEDKSRTEWDYNFKFRMAESQNYLVCQYKVLFNIDKQVSDTVWRRRQCEQIVTSAAAA